MEEKEDLFSDFELNQIANMTGPLAEGESLLKKDEEPVKTEGDQVKTREEEVKKETGLTIDEWANLDLNKEEKEETPADGDPKKVITPSSSKPSQMSSLAKVLYEAGVILSEDEKSLEEIKDTQGIIDLISKTVETKKYENLNDNQREYLKALESGVPLDVYQKKKADYEIYSKVTENQLEENENLRYSVIKNSLLIKGFTDTKASEFAKRSIEAGVDLNDAKEALEEIRNYTQKALQNEIETAANLKKDRDEKETKRLEALKSNILSKQKIFENIQTNTQTKQKILDSIITPVEVRDGVPVNDILKRYYDDDEFKIKLHAIDIITKGFSDFSKFINNNKTNAVKELEKSIQNDIYTPGYTQSGAPVNIRADETFNAFEKMFLNK